MLSAEQSLAELDFALDKIRLAPDTLVADLVLLGLAIDVQAQSRAAMTLLGAGAAECAYPNARTAFESAQQAVVLATHPDYASIGTRAWMFFARKDRDLAALARSSPGAAAKYSKELARLRQIAEDLCPGCGQRFEIAEADLDYQPKKPDNWLGKDMAPAYRDGLAIIFAALGKTIPANIDAITRNAFKALCRGTHARPRLDLAGIVRKENGVLFADTRPPNRPILAANIRAAVAGAAFDAMLAVCYRIARSA